MFTRAANHWPMTNGAAGSGFSVARSMVSNSERRLPVRGGLKGRLLNASTRSRIAALASSRLNSWRLRKGASTHRST